MLLGTVLLAAAACSGSGQGAPTTTTLSRPATTLAPSSTSSEPATTTLATATPVTTSPTTTTKATTAPNAEADETVALRFESRVPDVGTAELEAVALDVLNDPRGWVKAGFQFISDPTSDYLVVLAEPTEVDELCLPLTTGGTASCQNGPIVALNADRWRLAVDHWDRDLADYRGYLINHEVGHLIGQRHPAPRCPIAGRPAGVMEPQTGNLAGCTGNAWPRDWEIAHALVRPVVYAPLPDWGPEPVPVNGES